MPAGCSDPNNLKRSDASIKFATSVDIFADFLSIAPRFSSHLHCVTNRCQVMLLPLRLLMTLRISLRQKLGLSCLFSLGIIVIVFAFVRLFNVTKATEKSKTDPTTVANGPILLSLWSTIEAAVAVIVANLPAFRTLLRNSGNSGVSKTQEGYRAGNLGYSYKIGSKTNNGRSTIVGRSVEMESLHSFDTNQKARIQGVKTGNGGEVILPAVLSAESSQR